MTAQTKYLAAKIIKIESFLYGNESAHKLTKYAGLKRSLEKRGGLYDQYKKLNK